LNKQLLNITKKYSNLPWLAELRGQLAELVADDKCPHALLIHGPAGTGRRHLTMWLAENLLGVDPWRPGSEDGKTSAGHPDLVIVEPDEGKNSIGVDQVRSLIDFLRLTSHGKKGRVAIVWPAERMTINAANSLLKTLEEPPQGTVVVLISESTAKLPATVVSRCQRIRVPAPPAEKATAWLAEQTAGAELAGLLDFAAGAPLAALELHEADFATTARQFAADLRNLETRSVGPVEVAARWHKEPDLALQWLYWSLARKVRKATEGSRAQSLPVMQASFQQMTKIRELRRLLNGGINAELSIADLLMDWYGGFGLQ
jgi:DNA polymerase-3 subunit delta'